MSKCDETMNAEKREETYTDQNTEILSKGSR